MAMHATSLLGALALAAFSAGALGHVISEEDHHAFEHKYSSQCQERQKAAAGPNVDIKAVAAQCDCIALEESKRLTIQEVKKYLQQNKMPISLIMKSTGAAYNCNSKQFP